MKDEFLSVLSDIETGKLQSATISDPKNKKDNEAPTKIHIRPLLIKNLLHYQITNHYAQKVTHQNILPKECASTVKVLFQEKYRQGIFSTTEAYYHLLVDRKGLLTTIKKNTQQKPLDLVHNRKKNYTLPDGVPVPFLVELGIMTKSGQVIAKKYDKFRQINRFLEIVADILPHLKNEGLLEIIDFGCGKSSLTFALYHYLHNIEKRAVNITGFDLKKEVIENCQDLADRLGYQTLKFSVGDINDSEYQGKLDLMISLHACDTATDAALEKAISWQADVILCVPCCQHELYHQVVNEQMNALLRHGILKERFAALVTDAARAELLTTQGYDVQVMEFIDMEHTPKNILLRAIKTTNSPQHTQATTRYHELKKLLQITPSLEVRLGS